MPNVERVDGVGDAPCKGKEMDGIEYVGLTFAIASNEAVDFRRKVELGFSNVLII